MRVRFVTMAVLASTFLVGCNGDRNQVEKKALVLCRYGQLENPVPMMLPKDAFAADLISRDDLAFLAEKDGAIKDNPFGGIATAMELALMPAVQAMSEALGRHVKCTVLATTLEAASANVELEVTRPLLDGGDGVERLKVLSKMATHEERVAKVEEWIGASKANETTKRSLRFTKGDMGWRADYGLRAEAQAELRREVEAVVADLEQRIAVIAQKKLEAARAREFLAAFRVVEARFRKKREYFNVVPVIDLVVQNDTEQPISRVYFRGVLKSPERAVPWLEDSINYQISGGLEAGEKASWSLQPNMFSEWGKVEAPNDAVLTLEVIRLDGAGGKALASVEDEEKLLKDEAELRGWVEQLKEGKATASDIKTKLIWR